MNLNFFTSPTIKVDFEGSIQSENLIYSPICLLGNFETTKKKRIAIIITGGRNYCRVLVFQRQPRALSPECPGSFLPQYDGYLLNFILPPPGKAEKSWQVTAKSHFILLEVRCVLFVLEGSAPCLQFLTTLSFQDA